MTAENVAASEPEDVSGASYTNLDCSIAAAMAIPLSPPDPRSERGEGWGEGPPLAPALGAAPHPSPLPLQVQRRWRGDFLNQPALLNRRRDETGEQRMRFERPRF